MNGFEREATPEGSAGGYSYYYDVIKGFADMYAGKAKTISGITTPDDSTIVFQLTQPTPDFPYMLAMPAASPIPTGADVGHEKDYGQFLVATGPYMFQGSEDMNFKLPPDKQKPVAGNDPGRSYVLVRNPDYDPATDDLRPAYVDQIDIQVGGTESDLQNKVDAGDLDMCFDCLGLPTSALQKYETTPDLKDQLHIFANDGISYGTFNLGIPPFDDVHIRKAFNWIYPLNSTRQLGGGPPQGTFAGHWIPNGLENNLLQGYNPYATPDNNGDLAKAQAEIKLSKYDKNGDGSCAESPECQGILTIGNSSGTSPKSVALLQQALKPLGITLDPKFLDTGAMYAKCYTMASQGRLLRERRVGQGLRGRGDLRPAVRQFRDRVLQLLEPGSVVGGPAEGRLLDHRRAEHRQAVQRVLDEVRTGPVPVLGRLRQEPDRERRSGRRPIGDEQHRYHRRADPRLLVRPVRRTDGRRPRGALGRGSQHLGRLRARSQRIADETGGGNGLRRSPANE